MRSERSVKETSRRQAAPHVERQWSIRPELGNQPWLTTGPRSIGSCWPLLDALEFENGSAWKCVDFAVMDRLHMTGFITAPHGKQESVHLTEKGLALARTLAARYLAI